MWTRSRPLLVFATLAIASVATPSARSLAAPIATARITNIPITALPKTSLKPIYRSLPSGSLSTLLPPDGKQAKADLARFAMRALPVSRAEFARFVRSQPQWQASRVAGSALADAQYLGTWASGSVDSKVTAAAGQQPATQVSWFAAQAYCKSERARLPTWHEWEYAAAADATRADARTDPAWRARILDWYGQTSKALPAVGMAAPNIYGIFDLHGLIWEWVDDFGALMVSGDNRSQGDPDTLQFCGAGALSANDRENYPVLMRIAMLSSLAAASTNRNLGFRCVRPLSGASL